MKYGCHNRQPYKTSMPAQDGYFMDGVTRAPRMVSVPFRMSRLCEYRHTELGKKDTGCEGCKHKDEK